MMGGASFTPGLAARLPQLRGRLTPNAPIGRATWFHVGGPAEIMFKPADVEDLCAFMAGRPQDVPITVIGVASNLLVRDGGIPGVVIKLDRSFATVKANGTSIDAGAAAMDIEVARLAARYGIGDLEFLSGIPGTMGGGVVINAGAYGSSFADVLVHADMVLPDGTTKRLSNKDFGFSYRNSKSPADAVVVSARVQGTESDSSTITARLAEVRANREKTQPIRARTGGSTFKNPAHVRAWELIDKAGCRGMIRGGAQVSEQHCNFIVNNGDATAAHIEGLGEDVRRRVTEATGETLEWEIQRVGVTLEERGITA